MDDVIYIRAQSKGGGLTSIAIGGVALILGTMVLSWLPVELRLMGIFIICGGLVAILIGWFKLREPDHSLHLSRQEMRYHHRHGQWYLHWDNIQRFDVPSVYVDLQHHPLAVVGIRVKSYEPVLETMSPRLMNNIMTEQRSLLLQAIKEQMKTQNDYNDHLLEDDRYTSESGKLYTGLQAMFANRMTKLRETLGYDLFINVAELDRSTEEFVQLLRECKNKVAQED
ncbi:DUF2982 domain-containing protein [Paraneptunicella aestuarii]|uniref:DUF2982 domain-containing protein n=1 Tax=Paraneptunicella aestuarii TaxID=2831148 RepID=UPI001E2C37C5|nr:DUF2982 domain-containing protein [Paraneptunicella aestuarii]UAA38567.1 DUF2982 domain-containing protein [Paraneptunicella aestuarii]